MATLPKTNSTTAERVLTLTLDGLTAAEIAKRLELSQKHVHMVRSSLREEGLLPRLKRRKPKRKKSVNYLPTPEEIEAKCAEIRARNLARMASSYEVGDDHF